MHAMCERAKRCHRSGNVPRDCPKSIVERSQRIAGADDTATERFSPPNAGVKPPCGGAADMCKRSVKHMADATTWGRLERIVRRRPERLLLLWKSSPHLLAQSPEL